MKARKPDILERYNAERLDFEKPDTIIVRWSWRGNRWQTTTNRHRPDARVKRLT